MADQLVAWLYDTPVAVVTETLDRMLAAIPATPGDTRVLAVIRAQAERIRRD